jgi:hypothetical protein
VSDQRDDPSCQGCRFWQSENGEMGDCRRHAPRPIMDAILPTVTLAEGEEDTSDQAIWPVTFAGDWCGEFRERPDVFRPSWGPR